MAQQQPVAIVTGATSGIGLETALGLARLDWHVIAVGRSAQRGERALQLLRQHARAPVEFVRADLSSIADSLRIGAELAAQLPSVDLLINNAGSLFHRRQVSAEGHEMTFALNHLGYFTLTKTLLPRLRTSQRARIVNVASAAHYGAALDLDDLSMERGYSGWRAYQCSKLANVLFTRELARQLRGTNVSVNCLHPGFVASRFGSNNAWWWKLLFRGAQLFAISPRTAARAVVYLATAAELDGVSGQYFDRSTPATPSRAARDDTLAQRLWGVSDALIEAQLYKTLPAGQRSVTRLP